MSELKEKERIEAERQKKISDKKLSEYRARKLLKEYKNGIIKKETSK